MAETEVPAARSRGGNAKGNGRAGSARPGRAATRATTAKDAATSSATPEPAPRTQVPEAEPTQDFSPSRYIAVIDRHTGKEVARPIDPDDLLVHAHRDQHPVEVAAQYVA
ncbi:MAG: hypothetical protein ACREBE_06180, partial [bacterium]